MIELPKQQARLHLTWRPDNDAAPAWTFARNLASFLRPCGFESRFDGASWDGQPRPGDSAVVFSFGESHWSMTLPEGGRVVHVDLPVVPAWRPGRETLVTHLEPDEETALPLLTLFGALAAPAAASLHNLVALAHAVDPLEDAILESPAPMTWDVVAPGTPLVALPHAGCLVPGVGEPVLYARGLPDPDLLPLVDDLPVDLRKQGYLLRLRPEADAVRVEIATDASPSDRRLALLHALTHIRLGHVRPGDPEAHLDTRASIVSPRSRWDKRILAEDPDAFQTARPASLEECTPRDKAFLGLWALIGGMLGGTRPLHPKARAYQAAAYQRQAAERLVAQLDTLGGAMLCDGVGLGKTYVATTVMVHHANSWKEDNPADPFRVTVVAPASVVSTWEREAIPPLVEHGVPAPWVRVISHTKLSRLTRSSHVLEPSPTDGFSDWEHLVLSDLVIIDEAHNFRSESASRSQVLRDLLAIQPRKDRQRQVLLLTATPINNRLADLEQELSLLFSEPAPISEAKTAEAFRRQTIETIRDRTRRARAVTNSKASVAGLLVHGNLKSTFATAPRFRGGPFLSEAIFDLAKYLKKEEERLEAYKEAVHVWVEARKNGASPDPVEPIRVAEEVLDRVVVQRSRSLCKRIEMQEGSSVDLLFRRDPDPPERLRFEDTYNETRDVLARFLLLFPKKEGEEKGLSFKVYMWSDVELGFKDAGDAAPAVGLQRILALKRLESSPVSFLVTLLRLLVLHAVRLGQLEERCEKVKLFGRAATLRKELSALLDGRPSEDLKVLRWLCPGDDAPLPAEGFFESIRSAPEDEDEEAGQSGRQQGMWDQPVPEPQVETVQVIDRLWALKEILLGDLRLLLDAAPDLARIVFGEFDASAWPARFVAPLDERKWPGGMAWAMRLIDDAKLNALVGRLVEARKEGRKVVVFSQFKDTIGYIASVLDAARGLGTEERGVLDATFEGGLEDLFGISEAITGDTEERDTVIDRFAPFYRIGPFRPVADPSLLPGVPLPWDASWRGAMERPIDVLFATDVLAEGVNLQDVAVLVNYDIHWNPVRMIQRAGRIDRRLNPRIERAERFPDLEALALTLGRPIPEYRWKGREAEAPVTVNLILPDALEAELKLREKIAAKTLAIDVTLGLDRGTGAEADWMDAYTYQGVAALSVYDRDRAIEDLAGLQKELERRIRDRGIETDWNEDLGVWLREEGVGDEGVLIARAQMGREGGEVATFNRWLEPAVVDGVPHWLMRATDANYQTWLRLHGEERVADAVPVSVLPPTVSASSPLLPAHVAPAARRLLGGSFRLTEIPVDLKLWQGLPAIADGRYFSPSDWAEIQGYGYFLIQFREGAPC